MASIFSDSSLKEFINKGLRKIGPFVEFLRTTNDAEINDAFKVLVKIRDVCSHKLDIPRIIETNQLQSIAETIKEFDPILSLDLSTLKIYGQLTAQVNDVFILNRDVLVKFLQVIRDVPGKSSTRIDFIQKKRWASQVFKESNSDLDFTSITNEDDLYVHITEFYNSETLDPKRINITDADMNQLSAYYDLYSKLFNQISV